MLAVRRVAAVISEWIDCEELKSAAARLLTADGCVCAKRACAYVCVFTSRSCEKAEFDFLWLPASQPCLRGRRYKGSV